MSSSRMPPRLLVVLLLWVGTPAHASLLPPELEDTVANIISWVALIVAPIVVVGVFWMVHILPEKIAEKRRHPQAKAIQTLCLLSLFFGGLLWPLAWLWAYTKPVLYRMAYGTDVGADPHGEGAHDEAAAAVDGREADLARMERLRAEMAALQARLDAQPAQAAADEQAQRVAQGGV